MVNTIKLQKEVLVEYNQYLDIFSVSIFDNRDVLYIR